MPMQEVIREDTKSSEVAFHNARFAADGSGERPADRFYNITLRSYHAYRARLRRDCVGKRALEIGCGTGHHSLELIKEGAIVTGIDISDVAIEVANDRATDLGLPSDFRVMDAERLDFSRGMFNLVYGTGILHHLNLDAVLPEITRVMSPDGHAVFIEPMGHNPVINAYRKLTPSQRTQDEHPLTTADLRGFREHFGKAELRFFYLFTLLAAPLANIKAIGPVVDALDAVDQRLFAYIPALQKFAWMVMMDLSQPRCERYS